ncbi:MAG: Phosphoenolpyruvate carboxykinase [Candidatus Bathyarchaeota archaeon B23]|nr:MAG: Phosphoenolpyruvate carboxykinase [Candidatus Bathyarchaeota archaeon B23]
MWILWAEGRINDEYDALKTSVGYLPRYEDLKPLFREALNKDYRREDYELQFSLRIDKLLGRMRRIEEFYGAEPDMPEEFWRIHNQIKADLKALREESGRSMVPPSYFE